MKNSEQKIVVLGAGIGGLTAACELLKNNRKVILIDKDPEAGGQMKGIQWNEFCVDLGYKQFYSRIPEVQEFYVQMLGKDLHTYQNRTGVLFKGHIYERDQKFRGISRGMQTSFIATALLDLVATKIRYLHHDIITLEDEAYARKGQVFTRAFSQGFDEKLKGRTWASILKTSRTENRPLIQSMPFAGLFREMKKGKEKQDVWFHPVKGCVGFTNRLKENITAAGGEIRLNSRLLSINRQGSRILSVLIGSESGELELKTPVLISSLRIDLLARFLGMQHQISPNERSFRRGVIIIYLFLNRPVSFPHTCLLVTDPGKKTGRITNYGAYNCQMVPDGKGCLAFEIFCNSDDLLLYLEDETLVRLVKEEMKGAGLFKLESIENSLVFKLPFSDPATGWEDYRDEEGRKNIYDDLCRISNLYNVSRTGIDKTIYASIKAVESIQNQDKISFLSATAPTQCYCAPTT